MEISFEKVEKQCKECAADFIEELQMLPIFLNYFPDVQERWLEDAKIDGTDIFKIRLVAANYAMQKVKLENKLLPKTREDVIKIEDQVLKGMYVGKLFKTNADPAKMGNVIEILIKQEYPNSAVLTPEQLKKIEKFMLFQKVGKKFAVSYLVFDSEHTKIIGIEVTKK
jgi:hypothetical protein